MALDDIYYLAVDQVVYGVVCTNVFHYKESTAVAPGDNGAEQLVEAFEEDNAPVWAANLATDWSVVCLRAARIKPEQGSEFPKTISGVSGAVTGPALPANQVALISVYSSTISRRGRGRSYISGMSVAAESANHLTTEGLTNLGAIAGTFDNNIANSAGSGVFTPVVYSTVDEAGYDIQHVEPKSPFRKLRNRTPTICIT